MASRPTLPYFAPASSLPAPLPTMAEIRATYSGIGPGGPGRRVTRFGEHYMVKWGKYVRLQEGENMLFVRQSTNIPVPTLYALFRDEKANLNFIVQEYIPGKGLGSVWTSLETPDKVAISSQLRRNLDELRRIPSPGYYGGLWRQPTCDFTFMDAGMEGPHPDPAISGPQSTEEQWADAMWRCLDDRVKSAERRNLPVLRQLFQVIFRGHKSVFTHADMYPGNLILRDDKTVVIIDWEHAGWYPSFWEYCKTMDLLHQEVLGDWWEYVPSILDQYVGELGWMRIRREWLLFH